MVSLTACCTAASPGLQDLDHSCPSLSPLHSASHNKTCPLNLGGQTKIELRLSQGEWQDKARHKYIQWYGNIPFAGANCIVFYTYYNPRVPYTVHHESCIVHCNSVPEDMRQQSSTRPSELQTRKHATNLHLPDCYHTCNHPACGHYEGTAEKEKCIMFLMLWSILHFCFQFSVLLTLPDWSLLCRSLGCHSRSQRLDIPRLSAHTTIA